MAGVFTARTKARARALQSGPGPTFASIAQTGGIQGSMSMSIPEEHLGQDFRGREDQQQGRD